MLPETEISEIALLANGEPDACEVVNPDNGSSLLLLCDHASRAIPAALNNLGLGQEHLDTHIAYDIGAAAVARELSRQLDATLVLTGYSRLVIDANRFPEHAGSIPQTSGGVLIPGNAALGEDQRQQRISTFFEPYHAAVAAARQRIAATGAAPHVFSVHSFTPVFDGQRRPWHAGVLWNEDARMSAALLEQLRARPDLCVGDNQPYSALDPEGYTMRVHAESERHPHALIEIRQDLIADESGVSEWADRLSNIIGGIVPVSD